LFELSPSKGNIAMRFFELMILNGSYVLLVLNADASNTQQAKTNESAQIISNAQALKLCVP